MDRSIAEINTSPAADYPPHESPVPTDSPYRSILTYDDAFCSKYDYISICGLISGGKSTMVERLTARLKELAKTEEEKKMIEAMYEPVKKNPFLPLFYEDLEKHAKDPADVGPNATFLQLYFLIERYKDHMYAAWGQKSIIGDSSVYCDPVFAKMLHEDGMISDLNFDLYSKFYQIMTRNVHKPSMILYLDVKPEVALARIKKRGRSFEQGIPLEYLQRLYKGYEDWLASDILGNVPVLRLDWNEFLPIDTVLEKILEFKMAHKMAKLALLK